MADVTASALIQLRIGRSPFLGKLWFGFHRWCAVFDAWRRIGAVVGQRFQRGGFNARHAIITRGRRCAVAGGRRAGSAACPAHAETKRTRSEEHTSELQSLMRNSYAVFCLKK